MHHVIYNGRVVIVQPLAMEELALTEGQTIDAETFKRIMQWALAVAEAELAVRNAKE